jgi:hypothetical protein
MITTTHQITLPAHRMCATSPVARPSTHCLLLLRREERRLHKVLLRSYASDEHPQ